MRCFLPINQSNPLLLTGEISNVHGLFPIVIVSCFGSDYSTNISIGRTLLAPLAHTPCATTFAAPFGRPAKAARSVASA